MRSLTSTVGTILAHELRAHAGPEPSPIYWPTLTAAEASEEWEALRGWVELLQLRFPNSMRLPECWWQHNDLVEVLAALRDAERACYHTRSSAAAPADWHRMLREVETRTETWTKRFTCAVRGHAGEPEWSQFVESDVTRRGGMFGG